MAILSRNSSLCDTAVERETEEEDDRNESRTGHWKKAEARFRGTRILRCAYWGGECQNKWAPALRENAFGSCVLDRTERDTVSIVRRSERMKEVEGGRRSIKGRRGTVQSRKRWTDKSTPSMSKGCELSAQSDQLARKDWFFCSTRQFFKEIAILWRNSPIMNDEAITTIQMSSRDV